MPEKFKVVISGVSGRFPECDDVCTFKEKLYKGDNFVTTDNRKWPVGWKHKMVSEKMIPDPTGKMINWQALDHTVFKMNRGHASSSDVLNRIILEPSFEAMVDAGVNPYSLDGTNVAVFVSTSFNELVENVYDPNIPSSILTLIGGNKAMMSNRVSFTFNLKGSSLTQYIDAHGGLESLALGYRYVSEGFAEAAVVGAASNLLDPRFSLHYTSMGLLSPDGTTRPFDELTNGYARSEGVVCFYIQRAEDAKRSYGEILFSDVFLSGSVLPNFICSDEEYLKTTMDHLYKVNNFEPKTSSVAFVEMNACGNKHADKVEANTVAELLVKAREEPLMVGSIKSNTGHLEATAGFLAVLKAVMSLDCGVLAPNLPIQKLNDDIQAFKQKRLQVVSEKTSLAGDTIIVNSIGLSGSVGVAVVKQHENRPPNKNKYDGKFPRIALICGREENSLKAKLTQIENRPYNAHFIALLNDGLGQYMPLHTYRGFTLVPPPYRPEHDLREIGERNRPVWFIFSGMGSQWPAMGKSLLNLPLFAETVAKCDKVLRGKNIDIYKILTSDDPKLFDDIVNAFVGIITVQIGLYEVIKALGIEPDGIIGHSVGENGCAYADGCLTLEQAVLASWARGVASNEVKTIKGMMAAVGMGYAGMKDRLPDDVQVACHNSIDSCTLTGPAESVNTFVESLKKENIFARAVNVANIAYHSKYISELGPKLLHRLKKVIPEPKKRSSKWISTSVQEDRWDSPLAQTCSPEYLTNNLLSPVLFEEGCKHIPANAICIEFAPHGLLQAILKRSFPNTCTNIPLTNRIKTEDNLNFLLAAIGKLYIAGLEPQVNEIFPALEYPAPRETPAVAPYCSWNHHDQYVPYHRSMHLEAIPMSNESIPILIRDDSDYSYLKDHKINDRIVVPPSLFMYLAWQMLLHKRLENMTLSSVIFENVTIHNEVTMTVQDIKYAFVSMVHNGSGNFQIILQDEEEDSENFQIILTGQITLVPEDVVAVDQKLPDSSKTSKTSSRFYNAYKHAGYHLGENFLLVNESYQNDSGYQTNITWNGNWVTFLDILMKVQMFADNNGSVNNVRPVRLRRLEILPSKISSLAKGTLLPCQVDTNAKESICLGATLHGLRYKSISKTGKQLKEYRFVSYQNPRCQSVREFLKFCTQIAVENVLTNVDKTIEPMVSDLTRKKEYSQTIEQILREEVPASFTEESNSSRKTDTHSKENILIIIDELEELKKLGTYDNNCPMVLVISPFSWNNNVNLVKHFVEVTTQSLSGSTFTLLKKKCWTRKSEKSLVPSKDHQKEKLKSVSEMYFVIQKNIDIDDTSRLVGTKKVHPDARYLYIMDDLKDSRKLDGMIKKQMDLGLSISVLRGGEWGSYRNLAGSINEKHNGEVVLRSKQLLLNSRVEFSRIEYICLNGEAVKNDGTLETVISFAYSATTGTKKVMGLATTISTSENTQPELLWDVPSHWSSRDAAIFCYIYPQAYNLIFLLDDLRLDRILINVGGQYSLAEAIISLSLYRGFQTFVTVETDEEAVLFKERFPNLESENIFRSWNYEHELQKQRRACGVNLVINFLKGKHHVEASLRCVGLAGIYIEIGGHNCAECFDIGMYDFLRAISFYAMEEGVSNLLKLRPETKKKMKLAIGELINKKVIVPLRIKKQTSSMKVIRYQPSENHGSQVLDYNEKHSFIIVGADTNDYLWAYVIEWLISHGARNFIVFLEKRGLRSNTLHQINRLLSRKNVKILLASSSKLDTKREISSFLNETEKLGPLKGIFFEATKLIERRVSNLDKIISPDIPFVGLSSGGLKEFENRRLKGSPAILVHCDKPKDALTVLPHLHKLLNQDENNNAEVLYKVADSNPSSEKEICKNSCSFPDYYPRLQDYLPQDVEILEIIGQDISEDFSFIEMCSLSKRYHHCKGVFPIFALPALHSVLLEPLFKRLLYPVFSAMIPSACSIEETAQRLYQSLNGIQPSGPVTLISETWNLPLALELVTHLRLAKRKYKIFVLEANPKNWINQMGLDESGSCNVDLIFHFFSKGRSIFNDSISSEDKIKMYAQNASADIRIVDHVIKAANKLCDKIKYAAKQKFHFGGSGLLQNVTLFERHRPSDQTFKLSTSSRIIVLKEPSYKNLLLHPEISRIINENAEYSWS